MYIIVFHFYLYIHVGVRSQYRRQGIGRHLMGQLFRHVAGVPTCQLVYLHVLATNSQALGKLYTSDTLKCRVFLTQFTEHVQLMAMSQLHMQLRKKAVQNLHHMIKLFCTVYIAL